MSNPEIKLQVSLDNPNIESNVPGEQELRDDSKIEKNDVSKEQEELNNADQKGENETKEGKQDTNKSNAESSETDANKELATKEDFVLTPVVTITKQEAVFTKGDLKLQKISVTEDISGSETVTTVTREKVTLSSNGPDIKQEIVSVKRSTTDKHTEDKAEAKKPKTRIPTLRFRQAVDRVRKERRSAQSRKERETSQPTSRRSSIPRLKDSKIPCENTKDTSPQKIEKAEATPKIEDEFEKLYDDLVDGEDFDDNLSIASKIEDPMKLESTFEEIIHAYEENKIQPINVEKVKQSKIPLLKRKSEQEIEIPKQSTNVKKSFSLDSCSITSSSTTENQGKIQSVTLNKSPVGKGIVSKRIYETTSVQESSTSSSETLKTVVSKTKETNTQVSKRTSQEVVKEKINTRVDTITKNSTTDIKESVKISAPDFENLAIENLNTKLDNDTQNTSIISLKSEEQNHTSKTKEQKKIRSASKRNKNVINVKSEAKKQVNNEAVQQEELIESNKNVVKESGEEKASNGPKSTEKVLETKENKVLVTQSTEIGKLQELNAQSVSTTKSVSSNSKKSVEIEQREKINNSNTPKSTEKVLETKENKVLVTQSTEIGKLQELNLQSVSTTKSLSSNSKKSVENVQSETIRESNTPKSTEKVLETKENEVHVTASAEIGKLQEHNGQSVIMTKSVSSNSKKAVVNEQRENLKDSNIPKSTNKVLETKENEIHVTESQEKGKLQERNVQIVVTNKSVSSNSEKGVENVQSENIKISTTKTFEQSKSSGLNIDNSKAMESNLSQQNDLGNANIKDFVDKPQETNASVTRVNKSLETQTKDTKTEKDDTSLNISSEIPRKNSKTDIINAAIVKVTEKENKVSSTQNLKKIERTLSEKEDLTERNMQSLESGTIKREKTLHATKLSENFVNTSIFSTTNANTEKSFENLRRSREDLQKKDSDLNKSLTKEETSVAGELPALRSKISEVLRRIDSIEAHSKLIHEKKSLKRIEQSTVFNKAEQEKHSVLSNTAQTSQNKQNNIVTQIDTTEIVEKEKTKDSRTENPNIKEKNLTTEEEDEEDIPIIRGKVNRMLSRITSVETNAKPIKKDDDIPKHNRIVSAKIAMFERSESVETLPKTKVRCVTQIRRFKNGDSIEAKDISTYERPKIVDEVLKAMPAQVIDENQNKSYRKHIFSTETTNAKDNVSYEDSRHTFNIEIVDVQPKLPFEVSAESSNNKIFSSVSKEKSEYNVNSTTTEKIEIDSTFTDSDTVSQKIENEIKNGSNEGEYQPVYLERTVSWSRRNIAENSLNNKEYWSNLNFKETKNDSYNIQSRAKIVSDVKKQDVKYESFENNDYGNDSNEREISSRKIWKERGQLRIHAYRNEQSNINTKSKSLADLYLEDTVKGKVKNLVVRMNSADRFDAGRKDLIDAKERPRKRSVLEKIALFESKSTAVKVEKTDQQKEESRGEVREEMSEEECAKKIEELLQAKAKYGSFDQERMPYMELRDGGRMPVIGIGTALLNPKLTRYVVQAAIDLGYRTIDTAYIYGNEKQVGEAINEKIKDGTVKREDLFIISKLWSTFHRKDLVEKSCRESLEAMGLDYFDLYLIHNPMSFKEGPDPIPKIASVIQFSEYDYLDAWYGIENLVRKGLVKHGGVSNFNSVQVDRIVEKGKIKPAINQVECHPYLSQNRLEDFCNARNVKLCCFGVLGSKGTPLEMKSALPPAIEDPLVRVMAAGLEISPAVLLISYQLSLGRSVVVKASSPANLWNCLQALSVTLSPGDVSALHALNRNKRTFTFQGMGETHKNYPFNIPF